MNETINVILNRKSVRAFEDREIPESIKAKIIEAAMRSPTAGNMMLYSIIDVTDQAIKDILVKTCDNQPFIAKAPLVLLFLADYQRWVDYFKVSGVPELCEAQNKTLRNPEEGDLMLACCDTLIAAQTAVIAAESLGIGSCYIGDIIENYETHKELFELPDYVFPITMLCFGYPTEQQRKRALITRFDKEYIVFNNKYKQLSKADLDRMYQDEEQDFKSRQLSDGAGNAGQHMYIRKFDSDFSKEMSRSARAAMEAWQKKESK